MPSYTKEQRERALKVLSECEGRVTLAITKLGYPSRQTMYKWINAAYAASTRTAGRPFSHYDPQLKRDAVDLVRSGMNAKDVAISLGVSSAAVACNWARAAESEEPRMDDGPAKVTGSEPAWPGFDGTPEERMRQLQLENDILRGVVEVLKAASLGSPANREKALAVEHLRRTTDHSLKDLTASLRISKSPYEYQRSAISREDKYAEARARVAEIFEAANGTRGYRYVTHELRASESPIIISEKVVRRLMREEGCRVIYLKRAKRHGSYAGEISGAPDNLVKRDFRVESPTRCGSPTQRSSGSPAASATCPWSLTASTGPWHHGQSRPSRMPTSRT